MSKETLSKDQMVIHFGPVWYRREVAHFASFAACEADQPNAMSTHKPWVNCESCKLTDDFKGTADPRTSNAR